MISEIRENAPKIYDYFKPDNFFGYSPGSLIHIDYKTTTTIELAVSTGINPFTSDFEDNEFTNNKHMQIQAIP